MTNSPPPDPNSSQNTTLGFDEFIGIFIAFTAIGAIFFWSLAPKNQNSWLNKTPFSPSTTQPTPSGEAITEEPVEQLSPAVTPALPSRE